jgi:hypothetical protein
MAPVDSGSLPWRQRRGRLRLAELKKRPNSGEERQAEDPSTLPALVRLVRSRAVHRPLDFYVSLKEKGRAAVLLCRYRGVTFPASSKEENSFFVLSPPRASCL